MAFQALVSRAYLSKKCGHYVAAADTVTGLQEILQHSGGFRATDGQR